MIVKWIKQLFTRKPAEEWVTVAIANVIWCGAVRLVFFQVKGDKRRVKYSRAGYESAEAEWFRYEWEKWGDFHSKRK